MRTDWTFTLLRSCALCLGGGALIVLLAVGGYWLGFNFANAGFTLLTAVVLVSMLGNIAVAVVLSMVALGCLSYYFAPPLFSFHVDERDDLLAVLAFLTSSIVVTSLMAKVRRMREEELRQTRAELARFARVSTLGELTASIAHEVNQPLAGVVSSGNACQRWLANDPPNIERARQSLERIIRDANRASDVVGRVRGLAGNAPPQMGALHINEAIREVIVLTRFEVEQNGVVLKTQLSDALPPVWADRIQIQQVCLNLIVNAVDALGNQREGQRELAIATAADEEGGGVRVTVSDNGPGLDPRKLDEIFTAFFTTKPDGMGMGLAISRSIVDTHGGRLWAAANQPRGASFHFTLPAGGEEPS